MRVVKGHNALILVDPINGEIASEHVLAVPISKRHKGTLRHRTGSAPESADHGGRWVGDVACFG